MQTVSVSLNGKPLTYQQGNTALGGDATVTKDGSKYTFTGHAGGDARHVQPDGRVTPTS